MTKRRRGNAEGSVHLNARKGLWVASVSLGIGEDGRRRRRYVYAQTKAEVMEKLRALQVRTASRIDPVRLSVGDVLTQWREQVVAPARRPNTIALYETAVRLHIRPALGALKVVALRPLHVEAWLAELDRRGVGARTRELAFVVLSQALKHAVRWGYITASPTAVVTRPRPEPRELAVWTQAQAVAFLEAAQGDRLWALYVLAISTGMRQGELLGLQWGDVDLEAGWLAIQRTLVETVSQDARGRRREVLAFGPPKTAAGRRRVRLPQIALEALTAHRATAPVDGLPTDLVFVDEAGGPIRKSNLRRRSFVPLLLRAEVPEIRFHDLRHTAATLLLGANVHPRVVQERLGHADVATTLRTYSHVLPEMQEEANALMDGILRPKKKG